MKEREPKWYEEARKGPFREAGFTDKLADNVTMRLRTPPSDRERAGKRLRLSFIAAAILFLLAGAGAFLQQKGLLGEGRQAGFFYQEARTPDLTDMGIRKIAERTMEQQLGKKLPFASLERMEPIHQARIVFGTGEFTSTIRINTETGEVTEWSMSAFYSLGEIESKLISDAAVKLRDNGYEGDFTVTGLKHLTYYFPEADRGVETHDILFGKEGRIDYANGIYAGATLNLDADKVSEDVKRKAETALKLLRDHGADHLYQITRGLAPKWDVITLIYGENENGASTVIMDYATHELLQVEDNSLYIEGSYDSGIRGEQDTKLLAMDNAKLQRSAAVLADELFGIHLGDYTIVSKTPGNILFESPGGESRINAAFNYEGAFYSMGRQNTTPE
ncbi:hypothetical protein [Paenibacillus sp. HW567]|uniref:hypothetical protein n=1 Tax=Paenibacillus sp. HW567 TaxID=1034769 RepID=UPI00036AAC49|nr:hypothetical protein [Paenibacillus sp. HW567]